MSQDDEPEGYPDSPREELRPQQPPVSLELADRGIAGEGEVLPGGAQPPPDDLEDALADAPDVDQLAAAELGDHGSRPEDAANFEDNAAEWSRDRP